MPPDVIIDDPNWRRAMPGVASLVARAMAVAEAAPTVMLSSDRDVRVLNRTHRGIDKPTNVLTFEPAYPGAAGELVLAFGTVVREAQAERRPFAHHLAHLLVHGALHLQGEDHIGAGQARRMEMLESRLLHRLGRAQPLEAPMSDARLGLLDRLRARFRIRSHEHSVRDSIAELVSEAALTSDQPGHLPELDRHERTLIANVLRLRGATADDVMIPRADIVAIRLDTPLDEARAKIRREGHSRFPVYREQLDDIVGMIHIKDVFAHDTADADFTLQKILRTPLMVAPQTPVLDLLLQMRLAHVHLALVVDEYGGIDGLVTIEDLVETIVGDIADEHDEPDSKAVIERADGTFDLDGRMPIEAFEARFGPILTENEREADIDTVAGLVFNLAGRVPARGEVIAHDGGIEFRVLDADPRRIRRLRMRRQPV